MNLVVLTRKLEEIRQRQRTLFSVHQIEIETVKRRQRGLMDRLFEQETEILEKIKTLDWVCRFCIKPNGATNESCYHCGHKR